MCSSDVVLFHQVVEGRIVAVAYLQHDRRIVEAIGPLRAGGRCIAAALSRQERRTAAALTGYERRIAGIQGYGCHILFNPARIIQLRKF